MLAMIAVVVVLLAGLWNMMRGTSPNLSQTLMRWRVGLQFLAIVIAMILVYFAAVVTAGEARLTAPPARYACQTLWGLAAGRARVRTMVVLNKIYTRTGDAGTTALGTGERVPKHSARIAAYGTVDETNACIGVARIHVRDAHADVDAMLGRIQNDLFDLGADLCRAGARRSKRTRERAARERRAGQAPRG